MSCASGTSKKVQQHGHDQAGRLGKVDAFRHPGKDPGHVAHVAVHDCDTRAAVGQQRIQMRDDDRVGVDVRHPRVGVDLPRDFASGRRCRHIAANVDELAYPLVSGPGHRVGEEPPVLDRDDRDER